MLSWLVDRETLTSKKCDDESVPQMKYNFVPIGDLGNLQKDETCGESGRDS
jgi:hypothetical protein